MWVSCLPSSYRFWPLASSSLSATSARATEPGWVWGRLPLLHSKSTPIKASSYPFVIVCSGLRPSADHACHKQTGDQNLQLPGLLQLPAPASCMGLSQQLQLQPCLCHLSGGVPGWAGREETVLITWHKHTQCLLLCPNLYNSTSLSASEDHIVWSRVP